MNVHNRVHPLNLFLPKMYIQIVCVPGKYDIIRLAKARLVSKKRVSIFTTLMSVFCSYVIEL